jgi:hypothetical protein
MYLRQKHFLLFQLMHTYKIIEMLKALLYRIPRKCNTRLVSDGRRVNAIAAGWWSRCRFCCTCRWHADVLRRLYPPSWPSTHKHASRANFGHTSLDQVTQWCSFLLVLDQGHCGSLALSLALPYHSTVRGFDIPVCTEFTVMSEFYILPTYAASNSNTRHNYCHPNGSQQGRGWGGWGGGEQEYLS